MANSSFLIQISFLINNYSSIFNKARNVKISTTSSSFTPSLSLEGRGRLRGKFQIYLDRFMLIR